MFKLILIAALVSGCATAQPDRAARPHFPTNPMEVEAYLKKHVDAKTLKKWDAHISDDTVILELQNGMEGIAK